MPKLHDMAEIEANNVMDGQSVSNPGSLADVTPTGEQALDSLIETMRRGLSGDPSGTDPLISYDKEVTEEFSRWANLLEVRQLFKH
jgi:hypothetical protein